MPIGKCENFAFCERADVPLFDGLCRGCYDRQRRRGTLLPAYGRNGTVCERDDCKRKPFAKGLCCMHYQQTLDPMKIIWKNVRSRSPDDFDPAWSSFNVFKLQVGNRPSPKHQLRRIDKKTPWSAANCEWREPVRIAGKTGVTADMAAYQRAWSYLRRFGLSEADMKAIEQRQAGKCPVCDKALKQVDPETGKTIRVCVDHDHMSGEVRGILHDNCNKGIGQLGDDADNCERAAAYLRASLVGASA